MENLAFQKQNNNTIITCKCYSRKTFSPPAIQGHDSRHGWHSRRNVNEKSQGIRPDEGGDVESIFGMDIQTKQTGLEGEVKKNDQTQ